LKCLPKRRYEDIYAALTTVVYFYQVTVNAHLTMIAQILWIKQGAVKMKQR